MFCKISFTAQQINEKLLGFIRVVKDVARTISLWSHLVKNDWVHWTLSFIVGLPTELHSTTRLFQNNIKLFKSFQELSWFMELYEILRLGRILYIFFLNKLHFSFTFKHGTYEFPGIIRTLSISIWFVKKNFRPKIFEYIFLTLKFSFFN